MIPNHSSFGVVTRRDMGEDPIMISTLSAVQDVGKDFLPGLDCVPKEFEYAPGHVAVAHDIVGLPEQFIFRELRDSAKHLIGVSDPAFQIRLANDDLVLVKKSLPAGKIDTALSHIIAPDQGSHVEPVQ